MARISGRLSAAQLRRLEEHVQKEDGVCGQQDAIAIRLATEFHLLLAEMTNSPVLAGYVRELCLRCGLTLAMHGRPHSSDCAISEHREIISALRSSDAAKAVAHMEHHLRSVAERALVEASPSGATDLQTILAPYVPAAG